MHRIRVRGGHAAAEGQLRVFLHRGSEEDLAARVLPGIARAVREHELGRAVGSADVHGQLPAVRGARAVGHHYSDALGMQIPGVQGLHGRAVIIYAEAVFAAVRVNAKRAVLIGHFRDRNVMTVRIGLQRAVLVLFKAETEEQIAGFQRVAGVRVQRGS